MPKPIIHGRDHAPGGADPIPGWPSGGGGGSGIIFDQDPQAGDWLQVNTTDGNPTTHTGPLGYVDEGYGIALVAGTADPATAVGGGIILWTQDSAGAGLGFAIRNDDNAGIQIQDLSVSGGISIYSNIDVLLGAGTPTTNINCQVQLGEYLMLTNVGGSTQGVRVMINNAAGGKAVAVVLNDGGAAHGNKFAVYAYRNPVLGSNEWNHNDHPLLEIRDDGTYHIKAGATWTADL